MRQSQFLSFFRIHRAIYRTEPRALAAALRQMNLGFIGLGLTLLATLFSQSRAFADRNDLMFPPPAAVGKSIRVDGQGFVLNGKRTFIASGSLHYARVPRALWADRLTRMKRAGFNAVSTYIFWSFQEPRKGDYRFTGRRNLNAFLALVKKMRMYAILRIGPYNNGEWANGGLPNWLRFIPGMSVRSYNQPFLKALKPYFDRLLPMIAKNQITHGGPVVLVQIDNEYFPGWGAVLNNRYLRWLHAIAIAKGINVPFFFSGLNQGFNPAGNQPFGNAGRTTPWFTTEMWSGWFNAYRNTNPVIRRLVTQSLWRVISFGGNGYNVFMAVGGTNFSHWNCRSVRASYAFGAPVGQAGDLRSSYYQYKRANFFARSFAAILEKSRNATDAYQSFVKSTRAHIRIYARKSPAGTIVFLMNPGDRRVVVNAPGNCPLTINPGQTVPIILNFAPSKWFTLREAATQILGIQKMGNTRTLVMYGDAGAAGMLRIQLAANTKVLKLTGGFVPEAAKPGRYTLRVLYASAAPQIFRLVTSRGVFQVVAESKTMADNTWFVRAGGRPVVVAGPPYLKAIEPSGQGFRLQTDWPLNQKAGAVEVIGSKGLLAKYAAYPPNETQAIGPVVPRLGPWQVRLADAPAQPAYNDSGWAKVVQPRQMGYPDYPGDYEWYRTNIQVHHAVSGTLFIPHVRDHAAIFLNGKILAYGNPDQLPVHLNSGENTLAILAIAEARSKLFSIIGDFRNADRKGLWRNVRIRLPAPVKKSSAVAAAGAAQPPAAVVTRTLGPWRMHGGMGPVNPSSGWQTLGGPPGVVCFYRAQFQWAPDVRGIHTVLRVNPGTLSTGYMYLNGHNLGRYPDFNMPLGLYLPSCWLKKGLNTLIILDDAGGSPGATKIVAELPASRRHVVYGTAGAKKLSQKRVFRYNHDRY